MWGGREKTMGLTSGSTTLISRNTELVGDIQFCGSLEIEGKVKGNIYAEEGKDARVRVIDKGLVEGEITAPTVIINGTVNGDIHSSKHVELAEKAIIRGNVYYGVIEMVKGAQVNGNLCYAGDKAAIEASESTPKPVVETLEAEPTTDTSAG